jgi:hypothetical protein
MWKKREKHVMAPCSTRAEVNNTASRSISVNLTRGVDVSALVNALDAAVFEAPRDPVFVTRAHLDPQSAIYASCRTAVNSLIRQRGTTIYK